MVPNYLILIIIIIIISLLLLAFIAIKPKGELSPKGRPDQMFNI